MYPDTTFILFDTSPTGDFEGLDNVYGITFGQNEGGFLVAVYSALMTKTGQDRLLAALRHPDPERLRHRLAGRLQVRRQRDGPGR